MNQIMISSFKIAAFFDHSLRLNLATAFTGIIFGAVSKLSAHHLLQLVYHWKVSSWFQVDLQTNKCSGFATVLVADLST
jgi:hypothetical protein